MKFGFIIDNRKCIGCHACTTACKSEHDVSVGVNRTWVKQVEKGTFPNTRRVFSVMRCNHCTDAPCVEICPVEALFIRDDGIVDFNKDRCIGCKSCMQACPYDALYIDPENHTAAKCNYCAHRIDIGLEPACVNVCPEHAIISGDMDNPDSEISQLLSRQQVTVRKADKGTNPNLFYIHGDQASLNPSTTEKSKQYFWSSQARGVGHFAKYVEKMAFTNGDVLESLANKNDNENQKTIDLLVGNQTKRVYDAPDKGILWGWEVSAYVWTKAIAAGIILFGFISWITGKQEITQAFSWWHLGMALAFLGATGLLLIKDLDRPDRFINVLFRPQWKSWLVKGGYSISFFGLFVTLLGVGKAFQLTGLLPILAILSSIFAVIVAIYTAYLFAQAKGRDFWQSPVLPLHMLIHSIVAGTAVAGILALVIPGIANMGLVKLILLSGLAINSIILLFELSISHATEDAKQTGHMITQGKYKNMFWLGTVLVGIVIPILILAFSGVSLVGIAAASILSLIGIYFTEHIWVEAPQKISLS